MRSVSVSEKSWPKRYGEEIVVGLLICVIWAAITYLCHEGSSWGVPIFYGTLTASVVLVAYFAYILCRRIPERKITPSPENIEECVHMWLDNHKIMVKNDPHPDCHFRFRVTLESSGCFLTLLRSKSEYQEYVQILCDMGMRGEEEKKLLRQFSERERLQLLLDVKTELARAKVGYQGLADPPENFQIFQRVPIYPSLSEFVFISMLGNVEAARNLVLLMLVKTKLGQPEVIRPELISDTPKLEPPAA
jgi:hypothetical protein